MAHANILMAGIVGCAIDTIYCIYPTRASSSVSLSAVFRPHLVESNLFEIRSFKVIQKQTGRRTHCHAILPNRLKQSIFHILDSPGFIFATRFF